jgi:hypothetical protein
MKRLTSYTACSTCYSTDNKYLMWKDKTGVVTSSTDYTLSGKLWSEGYDTYFTSTFYICASILGLNFINSIILWAPFWSFYKSKA